MTPDEAWKILESADRLCDEATVHAAIARLAGEITARLKDRYPLVLAVMGGSIFFAGHLLPPLRFPLEADYVHASRYGNAPSRRRVVGAAAPRETGRASSALALDDILPGGETLAPRRARVRSVG